VPQLWCILKGEMCFVGPRPELFNQYDLINFRTEKNVDKVLPGLTGWSQVNGRDELPILEKGTLGETYNIGGWNEITNLIVVQTLCSILDELTPRSDGKSYSSQMTYVTDRPGHDRRYAIDASKIEREFGWRPAETFESGIRKTVEWYISNQDWVENVTSGVYKDWVNKQYGE
jgi:hypothetical protein